MGGTSNKTGNKSASFDERGDDLYETPSVAVRALLAHAEIPQTIWEPACGPGAIVRELRATGRKVWASDLIDYGCPESEGDCDFLSETSVPAGVEAIVTNPPFKLAQPFVAHALQLGVPMVVMLLRLAFLESERRRPILDEAPLSRILVFRKRLPMMHRAGWEGPKASSGMAFAWFIWQQGYSGYPTLERISWEPFQTLDDAA